MKCTQCQHREVEHTVSRANPLCGQCERWAAYCIRERDRMRELLNNPERLAALINRGAA